MFYVLQKHQTITKSFYKTTTNRITQQILINQSWWHLKWRIKTSDCWFWSLIFLNLSCSIILKRATNQYHHMWHDSLFENDWIFNDIPHIFGREEISTPKDVRKWHFILRQQKRREKKIQKVFTFHAISGTTKTSFPFLF